MSKTKTSFNVVEEKTVRLAVLIDADNASARDIASILDEVVKFGDVTVKRPIGRILYCIQRQRFHGFGNPFERTGNARVRLW